MPNFIHGRELSRLFFLEVVQPLLKTHFPALTYSAGLFGYGSEVLGFDTEMSRDHDWGPRLQLFLNPDDVRTKKDLLILFFSEHLPREFHGYSTNFGAPNEEDKGTRHMEFGESGKISHRIEIDSWEAYLDGYLPVSVLKEPSLLDWLLIPQQRLRSIHEGSIFHDPSGQLMGMMEKLKWYPTPVWLYLLASAWSRIGQEEHLMGRCGYVGDEIGSALLGNSLVRTLMQICFLLEKRYAPYPKWFGTAFQELSCSGSLSSVLSDVQTAKTWETREAALALAYSLVTRQLNASHLMEPVLENCTDFFGRPFNVIWGGRIAEQLQQQINDPMLRSLSLIGNVDIISTSTDVLENNTVCRGFRSLYQSVD